ncbi:SIN3-HDAC complex-associated factor-like [Saccoglossus kowalevskii]|uniref:Protein FAM60A-like n=1 Tax=Saccoglossus kowalevskii TaxID=10224 RepID=A0ABM0GPN5_SACKO|nr:PREDICTED: protein FAM60A-like [Saccoglossus kowalevskii]
MFSFHKPKVYRSVNGCCICKAKSSSSRFTDSKKYESDFERCFQLKNDKRTGEICNACVLLVKRWKKLPKGTDRNWHHVVDARAGPGTKAINKRNKLKLNKRPLKKRRHRRLLAMQKRDNSESDDGCGNDDDHYLPSRRRHRHSSGNIPSPTPSDCSSDDGLFGSLTSNRRKRLTQDSLAPAAFPPSVRAFLDLSFWKKEEVCCGVIFRGPRGEVLVDPQLLKPCKGCRQKNQPTFAKTDSAGEESECSSSTASSPTSKEPTEKMDFEQHDIAMVMKDEMNTDEPSNSLVKSTVCSLQQQQLVAY